MKFICERDALKDALGHVIGRTKGATKIPILTHVLIEAAKDRIRLVTTNLESSSQIDIKAEVHSGGAITVPCAKLAQLVSGLPTGAQVMIEIEGERAKVKSGRSTYQFPTLPAEDFPELSAPDGAVHFSLNADQVARLFKAPVPAASTEATRYYLCGVFLHRLGKKVAACATNGHTLLRTQTAVDGAPEFESVIVPTDACSEIARMGASSAVDLEVSRNLIAASVSDKRFVSKLIDGQFPDYERVIPQKNQPAIRLECADFDHALARLVAGYVTKEGNGTPLARLRWDDSSGIRIDTRSDLACGEEQVDAECEVKEPGEVAAQLEYFRDIVGALDGDTVQFRVGGPNDPIRVERPDTDDIVGVIMPHRW